MAPTANGRTGKTAAAEAPGGILRRGCMRHIPAFTLLFFFAFFSLCEADSVTGQEYRIKAGFIYNFAKFVKWPERAFSDPESPIILCIISSHPFSDVFLALNDKNVGGRKMVVIRYQTPEDAESCHILFFDLPDRDFIRRELKRLDGRSILTVGEVDSFNQLGGIINFFLENNRLRFRVNLDAAKRAGLRLSSLLLMSAEIYREAQP
jgi:hypothetical protein